MTKVGSGLSRDSPHSFCEGSCTNAPLQMCSGSILLYRAIVYYKAAIFSNVQLPLILLLSLVKQQNENIPNPNFAHVVTIRPSIYLLMYLFSFNGVAGDRRSCHHFTCPPKACLPPHCGRKLQKSERPQADTRRTKTTQQAPGAPRVAPCCRATVLTADRGSLAEPLVAENCKTSSLEWFTGDAQAL